MFVHFALEAKMVCFNVSYAQLKVESDILPKDWGLRQKILLSLFHFRLIITTMYFCKNSNILYLIL